jgi:ankyrin repeat protein
MNQMSVDQSIEAFVRLSNCILNRKYEKLENFHSFNLVPLMKNDLLTIILTEFPIKSQLYFIDNIVDYGVRDAESWNLLHHVIRYSRPEVTEHLLKKKVVNCNGHNTDRRNPLHFALQHCPHEKVGNRIIRTITDSIDDLEASDVNGWRAIHFAVVYCREEIVELLLSKGVTIDCATNDGFYPIHLAIRYGDNGVAECMTKHNGCDLEKQDGAGWRPIHYALRYDEENLTRELMSKVDIKAKTAVGQSIADFAVRYASPELYREVKAKMLEN